MCRAIIKWACLAAALCWSGVAAATEDKPRLTAGGLLFGDLYHVPSHHSAAGDGATGFVLRRGYLSFNADFGNDWFGRLRFEMNQSGEFETYTFEVDFKDLYLGRDFGNHRMLLGLSPTLTFDLIEAAWGLRYLARTPMDLQGVASRDTGVSLKGPLNDAGTLSYRAMVGAGTEFGNESGDGRKWMGALTWKPAERWTVDFYADYEKLSGPTDRTTLQAFLGYGAERLRWGVQYSNQDREQDPPLELASGFLVADLSPRISAIGRVDRLLEPSPKGDDIAYLPMDPSATATIYFAGLEIRLHPHFTLTPNAVVTTYDRNDPGARPETDVYLRLTAFFNFE
jgi:hypothetical protein